MLKIHIICVGKLKEKFFGQACDEYIKRLSRFATVKVTEIAEAALDEESPALIQKALQKEGDAILNAAGESYKIALCVEGKMIDSPALANKIKNLPQEGYGALSFIIGSSHGLDEKVKKAAHFRLSFSPMTFPHQLMRVVLLEQIYRAFKIAAGEKYHK